MRNGGGFGVGLLLDRTYIGVVEDGGEVDRGSVHALTYSGYLALHPEDYHVVDLREAVGFFDRGTLHNGRLLLEVQLAAHDRLLVPLVAEVVLVQEVAHDRFNVFFP